MKTTQLPFCSFKLLDLLKEKGFDKECLNFYTNPKCKMFGIDDKDRYYPIRNQSKKLWVSGNAAALNSKNVYYAPTIAEVVMWLYEKHGIWIEVFQNYGFLTFSTMLKKNGDVLNNILEEFNSPKEAYEAAIEYILNNLI